MQILLEKRLFSVNKNRLASRSAIEDEPAAKWMKISPTRSVAAREIL